MRTAHRMECMKSSLMKTATDDMSYLFDSSFDKGMQSYNKTLE